MSIIPSQAYSVFLLKHCISDAVRLKMDTTDKEEIQQAVEKLRADEGKLHILVNK